MGTGPALDTVPVSVPDSIGTSECVLSWKSVLGDSTVQVASLDLRSIGVPEALVRGVTVVAHPGSAQPGYALTVTVPAGALRLEHRGEPGPGPDDAGTEAIVAADIDSALVAAYADIVNAALRACRARRQ